MTFDEWMERVDAEIGKLTYGMITHSDLVDWMYYDAFEDGATPAEAARDAIENDDLGAAYLRDIDAIQ